SAWAESVLVRMTGLVRSMRPARGRSTLRRQTRNGGGDVGSNICAAPVGIEVAVETSAAEPAALCKEAPPDLQVQPLQRPREDTRQGSSRRRQQSQGSRGREGTLEHCRLRASRGHLFEHFCREAFRHHAPLFAEDRELGPAAEEVEVKLADFALRLRRPLPWEQFLPPCFEACQPASGSKGLVLQPGVVVFEAKQNAAAAVQGLRQLETRLAGLQEPPSAAVLLASASWGEGDSWTESLRRAAYR
ncbi:unnamed protein product, partial [Polarella glacialis]